MSSDEKRLAKANALIEKMRRDHDELRETVALLRSENKGLQKIIAVAKRAIASAGGSIP